MATGTTKLVNMINPEVMADMISATLTTKIKFSPLAKIDNTLVGQPGDTITVPKFAYIGDAIDVAEGVAIVPELLTSSSVPVTVKKAGKAVEITDEAMLSGYGDPVGESNSQLQMAIASKVDTDCIAALGTATLSYVADAAKVISYAGVVGAVDLFAEEDYEPKVLFVNSKQVTALRADVNFLSLDKYPVPVIMTGVIGQIAGCQVVVSNRIIAGATTVQNFIVKANALTIYLKRDTAVESDRDILKKTSVIVVDKHFVAVLSDASKVVKATFLK